jgi:predicted CxxxxCH...CXXCH cytochrome family protein
VCHPCGGVLQFGGLTYTRGTQASGTATAATGTAPATCTVQCHSPIGAAQHTVAWNAGPLDCTACHTPELLPSQHPAMAPTTTGADCKACHDTSKHTTGQVAFVGHPAGWMVQNDPGFHAFSANQGLASCQGCHGQDLKGGFTSTACGKCHDQDLPAGVTTWSKNCVMCHGGTQNGTGAPPHATWGNSSLTSYIGVGAHTAHVSSTAVSPGFGCSTCHVTPADAFAANHIDGGPAEVAFTGRAVGLEGPAPSWARSPATCSNTYCHGAFRNGNAANAPVWTSVGTGQGACGTCHAIPPGGAHPAVGSDRKVCTVCHGKSIDGSGTLIPPAQGGLHLDGLVEATGHDPSWMNTASPDFHAFSANRSLTGCTPCHGADLAGGSTGVGCAQCHGPTWKTSCTMCHGTLGGSAAPPASTWGTAGDPNRGGGTADPIRVGAHTKHIATTSLARPFACAVCHVVPADPLAAGHVDGSTATVTFAGLAAKGPRAPAYARKADNTNATCATTWCHGGYAGTYTYETYNWGSDSYDQVSVAFQGKPALPGWLDGAMKCDSCHGNPPRNGTWHSGQHGYGPGFNACELCHPDAVGTTAGGTSISVPALHVNGVVDVSPDWGNRCFGCH